MKIFRIEFSFLMQINSPFGLFLVSKDDNAERVLFMYPFNSNILSHSI